MDLSQSSEIEGSFQVVTDLSQHANSRSGSGVQPN